MKKYLYILPTLLTIMYITFIGVCWVYNFNINNNKLILISLIFTIPALLHLLQTISAILDSVKNNRIKWVPILLLFNIIVLPYYNYKYILKRVVLKNTIITYLISAIFLSALMGLYTITTIGKDTQLIITTTDGRSEFDLTSNWKKKSYPGYSLYAENGKNKISFGVSTFDLKVFEGYTLDGILEDQKNYLATKVDSLELFEEVKEEILDDKTIKHVVYKVKEKEDKEYSIYILSVITFKNDPDYVLYVFEQAKYNNYNKNKSELESIIKEVKLK